MSSSHPARTQTGRSRRRGTLAWAQRKGMRLPPQDLHRPSHFPYDTQQAPRRLDYVATKGVFSTGGTVGAARDIARSDHEPVILQIQEEAPRHPKPQATCGPRHVHITDPDRLQTTLDEGAQTKPADRHNQIAARPSPNREEPRMRSSLKAASSSKQGGAHTICHQGGSADLPGKAYTSSCTRSTKPGSSKLQPEPANTTGQHTDSTSGGRRGTSGLPR